MKRVFPSLSVVLYLFSVACGITNSPDVNRPQPARLNYPVVIESSNPQRRRSENAWQRLLEINRVPVVPLDLDPALTVPRALPAEVALKIPVSGKTELLSADQAKEALRQFITANMRLLAGDPRDRELTLADLSLISFAAEADLYRATYRQMNFPFPIAKGYGELRLVVNRQGALLQLTSRLLPMVDLPSTASVDSGPLAAGLVGRVFRYSGIDGRGLEYQVSTREEVSVKDLTIFPKEDGERLLLYLAYPVEVGRGTTWTVFFDAVTGQ
ncbi:MAG: hypothetical protein ABI882_13125, partial [Acidobacteriota bacterium]